MQIQSKKSFKQVKRKKASMTIMVSLCLLMITSLLLALLESARVYGLKSYAKKTCDLTSESALADYNKAMFEKYDLLFLDLSYGDDELDIAKTQGRILELSKDNLFYTKNSILDQNTNLFQIETSETRVMNYQLATDSEGIAFYEQVVEAMKQKLPYETVERIKKQFEDMTDATKNNHNTEQEIDNARNDITQARDARQQQATNENKPVIISKEEKEAENPLDFVLQLKSKGILGLVLEDSNQVSNKALDSKDDLQNRAYESGNLKTTYEPGLSDRAIYQAYIQQYFANYQSKHDQTALDYEQEYLLCGNDSDLKNLESTVDKLLLLREAANFSYLLTDVAKTEEALGLATALVGFTANPPLIAAVQYGILAAWAFVESIIDVRMLLSGNSVVLLKTQATWTTDILHISSSFEAAKQTKSTQGLSYEQYLQGMLVLCDNHDLALRTMNLMEKNIRIISNDQKFQFNHLAQRANFSYVYEARPLFSGILAITKNKLDIYTFRLEKYESYLPT